jgi:hypothetical protein
MAELTRVPTPKSPFNGRWGTVVGLVLAGFALAIVKPWSDQSADPSRPVPFTTPGPPAVPIAVTPSRPYDPSALGRNAPEPAWELWAADHVSRIRFVGPPDGFTTPGPSPDDPIDADAAEPILAGPVIDLGSSDDLGAFAVNSPADVELAAVRLWRFNVGGKPDRVELRELAPPWPAEHFRVFGPRDGPVSTDSVPAWQPGLYRLDLLVDPVDRIRSLLLVVRPGVEPTSSGRLEPTPTQPLDVELLKRLPEAATIWSFGTVLTGWSRDVSAGGCLVSEIWRASNDDPCRPIPLGRPLAVGVNLPSRQSVTSIRLSEVDPLPGPVDSVARTSVDGRGGVALVEVRPPGLHDGIYRLDVVTSVGRSLRWYVEVGPDPLS